jgi:hypothetical protein
LLVYFLRLDILTAHCCGRLFAAALAATSALMTVEFCAFDD